MEEIVYTGRHVLQWHITHRCNLRCSHCYQRDYTEEMGREQLLQALDQYTAFLDERHLLGQVNLTGGEPLSHPHFLELCYEIRRRGLSLAILTNGTLIDREMAREIALCKPFFIQVSLDGMRKSHDRIRGNGAFERALLGIDCLKAAGVHVLVSFTAQSANYRQIIPLSYLCKRHHVDKLWFDRVVIPKDEDLAGLSLTTKQTEWLIQTAAKLRRNTPLTCDRALQFLACGGENCYHCGAGRNLLIFLANGDIMPCRRLPFVIGNLADGGLGQIVENSACMQNLRTAPVPDECRACQYASRCRGGAKCVTYAQTGELFAKDVNCFI